MIKRTFHPIGQGAFYSERHDNFTIVYDCGNLRNTKLGDKVVTQAFPKDYIIDILFISHLDWDHISKIKTLSKHVKIKRVIMPLLQDDEKKLLTFINNSIGNKIISDFINSPNEIFDNDTKIIEVLGADKNESIKDIDTIIDINNIDTKDINNNPEVKQNNTINIKSGTKISINSNNDWIYIPFNYKYDERSCILREKLEEEGFNVNELIENEDYALNCINDKTTKNKIKKIYESLDGTINQNSMIVYSGPFNNDNWFIKKFHLHSNMHFSFVFNFKRVACIYTGDADLNVTNIRNIFNSFWKYVGTIQIPHHGAISSFNINIFNDNHYLCPISTGNNSFGHPSSYVIAEILSNMSIPVIVNEDLKSTFVQIIDQ